MTISSMPSPYPEPAQSDELAKAEQRLHALQGRLQRLQADFKVTQTDRRWPVVDRRQQERRRP